MPGHDLLALLPALFEGAYETPMWSGFLDRLRAAVGADYASLIFRPPAPSRPTLVHLYAGQASPDVLGQLYRDHLHERDPLPYHELEEGRLYRIDELLRDDDPVHAAFRDDMLEPSGMNALRLMRLIEPSGVNIWLTVSRREGDFDPPHDALLVALMPYVRTAMRGYVAQERQRFTASVAEEAIRRLNFGWMTLDTAGRVLDADPQGARLLTGMGLLRQGRGDRLVMAAAPLGREISEAVRLLAGRPEARPRALVLSRDPWLDMLLVPTNRKSVAGAPAAAVVAYVHGDSWTSADRCDQLAELFDLPASEARLALALSRGMSIAEAAAELGLTVETARNYSKRIYAKTGARGLPDLVRFIHRSVLAIA
jgi:DNA-binding CsgD family transcriptional regulator